MYRRPRRALIQTQRIATALRLAPCGRLFPCDAGIASHSERKNPIHNPDRPCLNFQLYRVYMRKFDRRQAVSRRTKITFTSSRFYRTPSGLPVRYIPEGMRLSGNSQNHFGIFRETCQVYFFTAPKSKKRLEIEFLCAGGAACLFACLLSDFRSQ